MTDSQDKPVPNKRPWDKHDGRVHPEALTGVTRRARAVANEVRRTHPLVHESYLPEFVPTTEQRVTVQVMMACGMKRPDIARVIINPHTNLPITIKTMAKHFAYEIKHGLEQSNAMVARSLFQKCLGNSPQSVAACIFWLRSQAGWLAPESIEMNMNDKNPGKQQLVVYVPDNGRRAANTDAKAADHDTPNRYVRK